MAEGRWPAFVGAGFVWSRIGRQERDMNAAICGLADPREDFAHARARLAARGVGARCASNRGVEMLTSNSKKVSAGPLRLAGTFVGKSSAQVERCGRRFRIRRLAREHGLSLLLAVFGMVITVAIRLQLFGFHSGDLDGFFLVWCDDIKRLGLARALKESTINYNPPYVYLLWLISHLPFDRTRLIKAVPVVCDYLCAVALAGVVYRIHKSRARAAIAGFALLIVPTVIFNGALWGQCDMLYTVFLVAGLLGALHDRYCLTTILFGLAIAVKLQAIFLFPLLGVWVLRKEFPLRPLLLIPAAFLLCLVPAWLAGAPSADLLMIYPKQTEHYSALTLNAPTIFTLLPDDGQWFAGFGLWFAVAATFMVVVACLYSRERTSPILTTKQAMVFSCLTPFLLPHMHERYIFLGDVISVLYAFVLPRYFWVALLVVGASFASYFSFLFGKLPIPLPLASVMLGVASVFLTFDLLRSLYPGAFAQPKAEIVAARFSRAAGRDEMR
jgi:Gpi18-like mannosyltransferase